uniref:sodium/glucose cotransporter 4-like n=1 Tax=Styela clava TaxID=7725 RepID=UPI001939CA05|nr:sodium/glucose cotransporter 4-like [Styela clava]
MASMSTASYSDQTTAALLPDANLETWDFVVIGVYFAFILAVGIWAMCSTNRGNVDGFFLAGRHITWFPVGASLFSSNIGSGSFVGLAGTGVVGGIAVGAFEWNAMLTLFFLGWIFAPVYIAAGVVTMPEYLEARFGGQRIQVYLSVLSMLLYILTKVSADLYSGAIFIQEALGWNIYLSMVLLLLITGLYTVTGGLAAVIYTDTAQTLIITIGSVIMMALSFESIGGYDQLETKYMQAVPRLRPANTTCGEPREDSFSVFRDPVTGDLPWPGLTFGLTILATWYWCTDQVIVQRTLAAKNLSHAKGGCVLAGFIKIMPMYTIVMVGMVSRIVLTDAVACVLPEECMKYCGSTVGCSNVAYPKLVLATMPTGAKGLLLAAMVAAFMSSLTSVFNSASTLFTCDIWTKIRKNASQRELMIVGRVFILGMVGVSIAWVPIIQEAASGQLFDYIQAITSYLGPPIATIFVTAVFWPRLNEPGAFWSLLIGMVIGITRMILDFVYTAPLCGEEDTRPLVVSKVHYLYFALILTGCTLIVAVSVSLCTPPIASEHLYRLTFWTRLSKKKRIPIEQTFELHGSGNQQNDETEGGYPNAAMVGDNEEMTNGNGKHAVVIETHESHPPQKKQKSWLKRGFDLFCGFDDQTSKQPSPDSVILDINEKKWPALIVNIACVFMLATMVFLFAYYA